MKRKVKAYSCKNITQLTLSILITVVMSLFSILYYSYTSGIIKENIQLSLRNFAVSAQYILNGDDHKQITSSDSQLFKDQVKILSDYKNEVGIYDVYTVIKTSETSTAFVLAAYDAESTFMKPYILTESMKEAFQGEIAVTKEPYRDAFGTFYSGYAPLFDSEGQQVAIVAIDINNAEIEKLRKHILINTLLLWGVGLLISNVAVFFLIRYMSRYFSHIIVNLKSIGEGDFTKVALEPTRIIELNDLGDTVQEMALKIDRLMTIIRTNADELEEKTIHIMSLVRQTNTSSQIISSAVEHMSDAHDHASDYMQDSLKALREGDFQMSTRIDNYRKILESVNQTKDNLEKVLHCLQPMGGNSELENLVEQLFQNYDVFSGNVTTQLISLDQAFERSDQLADIDDKITKDLTAISLGNQLILEAMEQQVIAIKGITEEVACLEEMALGLTHHLKQFHKK
ncbi:MAG: hypothetical protein JXO44_05130 [Clostridia bacterium]|nr:hypothetical protein [Clostridia bacterium]